MVRLFLNELGLDLKEATTSEQLGRAKSVKVQKENTVIVDGEGNKDAINARIAQIKGQIEETTSEFDKEKLQERLAKLSRWCSSYPCWCCYRNRDERS